jgi:thiosulfate/3-mercaptopyruvate sulfurtransferase
VLRLPGPIVSIDWLQTHIEDPALRVADVRWALDGPSGRERYEDGHLPGAVFLDADGELSSPGEGPGRHPIPTAGKLARTLGGRGIGDEHVVVAYDDAGGSIAARLWWLYRHYGRDGRCAVLDGGIRAWSDAGLPLTIDEPAHPPASWTPGEPRDDVVGTATVGGLSRSEALLLAARAAERYRGETEPIDPRAGHIPGAVSVPWDTTLGADGRFLPADTLRRRFEKLGAGNRPVIAYCGSSLTATHDLLALELAGLPAGRLYEGSWSHWSSDPDRPAATGASP